MANQYGLYLARERTVLRFPMNPESYQIQRDTENGEYNVLGVGPVMVPRTPKLQRISWSGLLPASGEYQHFSSSMAREMIRYRQPLENYLPASIIPLVREMTEKEGGSHRGQ